MTERHLDEAQYAAQAARVKAGEEQRSTGSRRGGSIANCPIREEIRAVIRSGTDFTRALRRLRRRLDLCKDCANRPDCPLLQEWNSQIEQAIQEITEEWISGRYGAEEDVKW